MAVKESNRRWLRPSAVGGAAAAVLAGLLIANAPADPPMPAAAPPEPSREILEQVFRNGEAGFVVTEIAYALGPDAEGSNACPNGLTAGVPGLVEAYGNTPEGARLEGESDQAFERRVSRAVHTAPTGENLCMHPELAEADTGWRMVSGKGLKVPGIDLDGQNSASGQAAGVETCAHEDFAGSDGGRGVDNQWYRVIGCTTGFQSTGQANGWQIEMYTGSWGILLAVKGVDDPYNDDDVEIGIYANNDPIQLSASRAALSFATYAMHQDPRYRATTRGRIVNGVLTSDPVNVRFINVVNSMSDDRVLRDARLRLTFTADGGMEGFLAGYTPVEDMYNVQFGARASRSPKGELAPEGLRLQTSMGRAGALGHTCQGAYQAMYKAADGHRDPTTGRCTSLSTQYRIRVAPAFVVDVPTQSVNTQLTAG